MAGARCWAAAGPPRRDALEELLRSLADPALRGVKLGIADDHKGLRAAASKVFHASLQRCRVHWMRNAMAHVPAKQRPAVMAMIKTIFAQETAADAHAQWKSVADALRERAPRLAELILNPAVGFFSVALRIVSRFNVRLWSGRLKHARRVQLPAFEVFDQRLAEDAVPSFDRRQLLRG